MEAFHVAHSPSMTAGVALSHIGMWFVMMSAMMAPTVYPWVRAFQRFQTPDDRGARAAVLTGMFLSGYLAVWLVYSVAASALQLVLTTQGTNPIAGAPALVASVVFITAGLFQFTQLKRACLRHCRNPFSYFLSRWRNRARTFTLGFNHGLFCVGCCWAVMATGLVVGVMNIWWMAGLTLAVFLEQTVLRGDHARRVLGIALIAVGLSNLLG